MKPIRTLTKHLIEHRMFYLGAIGAMLAYWWQVEQGSDDWGWNYVMAILGLVGGTALGAIE